MTKKDARGELGYQVDRRHKRNPGLSLVMDERVDLKVRYRIYWDGQIIGFATNEEAAMLILSALSLYTRFGRIAEALQFVNWTNRKLTIEESEIDDG